MAPLRLLSFLVVLVAARCCAAQSCPSGTQFGRVVTTQLLGARAADLAGLMDDCKEASCGPTVWLADSADERAVFNTDFLDVSLLRTTGRDNAPGATRSLTWPAGGSTVSVTEEVQPGAPSRRSTMADPSFVASCNPTSGKGTVPSSKSCMPKVCGPGDCPSRCSHTLC